MKRTPFGWWVLGLWMVTAPVCLVGCPQDDVECEGEDHRPKAPASANDCHEAYRLYIRTNECIEGYYDGDFNKGLTGRNAQLAYHYALADHATSAEIADCGEDIVTHEATIAEEDCATPSVDCGPERGGDNPCHDYYTELLEYRQRCTPATFGSEGTTSYDAAFEAHMEMAYYASDSEQGSVCGGIAYYQDANDAGTCYR